MSASAPVSRPHRLDAGRRLRKCSGALPESPPKSVGTRPVGWRIRLAIIRRCSGSRTTNITENTTLPIRDRISPSTRGRRPRRLSSSSPCRAARSCPCWSSSCWVASGWSPMGTSFPVVMELVDTDATGMSARSDTPSTMSFTPAGFRLFPVDAAGLFRFVEGDDPLDFLLFIPDGDDLLASDGSCSRSCCGLTPLFLDSDADFWDFFSASSSFPSSCSFFSPPPSSSSAATAFSAAALSPSSAPSPLSAEVVPGFCSPCGPEAAAAAFSTPSAPSARLEPAEPSFLLRIPDEPPALLGAELLPPALPTATIGPTAAGTSGVLSGTPPAAPPNMLIPPASASALFGERAFAGLVRSTSAHHRPTGARFSSSSPSSVWRSCRQTASAKLPSRSARSRAAAADCTSSGACPW
mmetsp:Transcript_23795/g.60126  ORF Transcript_23795/g.60126 Transcript_23795/m.60126 type:complete len:410 (-) Transcript_23795:882-2111(-)